MSEVYKAMNAVQSELAQHGIGKDAKNKFDNYKYRSIDAVFNRLSPLLAKHKLLTLPRVVERECVERPSQKGGMMQYTTLKVEYDFVSAEDGSKHTVAAYGEAMDRSDKSTNKAMAAAYKYAVFQTFCVPTEDMQDADAESLQATTELDAIRRAISEGDAVAVQQAYNRMNGQTGDLWQALNNHQRGQIRKALQQAILDQGPASDTEVSVKAILEHIENGDAHGVAECVDELEESEKYAVWRYFMSDQQAAIKEMLNSVRQPA